MYQVFAVFGMAKALLLPFEQILLLKLTSQVEYCNILPQILQCQSRTYKCEVLVISSELAIFKREEIEMKSVSPLTEMMCRSSQELGITWIRPRRHFSSSAIGEK